MPNKKLITPRARRLVRRAIKAILAEPKRYSQSTCWLTKNGSGECGSPNCIGGWICWTSGRRIKSENLDPTRTIARVLWGTRRPTGEMEDAVLRFFLFHEWPEKFQARVRIDLDGIRCPTPRRGQLRMEHWLATDGQE